MVVAILLMLEAWVMNIGYSFRQDQDVINYVSFASTIASLLLAVIAIIYGYFQADGQQKSAAAIAAQLQSMSGFQGQLSSTAGVIADHMKSITSTTDTLTKISGSIDAATAKISSIEGGIADVHKQQKAFEQALAATKVVAQQVPPPADVGDIVSKLLSRSSYSADLVAYGLAKAFEQSGTLQIPLWKFLRRLSKTLGAKEELAFDESNWFGAAYQVVMVLSSLGALKLDLKRDNSDLSKIVITSEVLETVKKAAKATAAADLTKAAIPALDATDFINP